MERLVHIQADGQTGIQAKGQVAVRDAKSSLLYSCPLHGEVLDTKSLGHLFFKKIIQVYMAIGRHVYKTMCCCFTYLSFAHRGFVPQQDVMGVGYFAHKFLPKPLSIDG